MRKTALLTLLSLITLSSNASVTTTVANILEPGHGNENYELLAGNGRVYEVSPDDVGTLAAAASAMNNGSMVELDLEEGLLYNPALLERVNSIVELPQEVSAGNAEGLHPMSGYEPSELESMDQARRMFGELKERNKWFTQCFNRAHVWSRQMHKDYGVKSQKILIYYTPKYRSEVDKKWWFHIAPMVVVNGERIVMDKEFTREPLSDEKWESVFTVKMRNQNVGPRDYRCQKIVNISEYYDRVNANSEYCNIQHTSMYYWEPNDMSRLEKEGKQKTEWVDWEIKAAAKEIMWGWKDFYKEYRVR